jgi:hypothetical protein
MHGRAIEISRARAVGDIFKNAQVGPDGVVLKDHRRVAVLWRDGIHPLLVEKDVAAVGRDEPGQHSQHGRLAAAGRPEQKEHFAGRDGEGDVIDHARIGAVGLDQVVGGDSHGLADSLAAKERKEHIKIN